MIRTCIWYTYFWLFMVFSILLSIPVPFLSMAGWIDARNRYTQLVVRTWARSLIALAGGKVQVNGVENIPAGGNVCYIANHQGSFDIPIILCHLPGPIGFIAKKELKNLPIVSMWMKTIGCIFLDRSDRRAAVEVVRKGVEQIRAGHGLILFPEGTRSRGHRLGTFKHGSLKLPVRAGATVVPVSISGSYRLKEQSGWIAPAEVTVTIHDAIDASRYTKEQTKELSRELAAVIGRSLPQDS